MQPGDDFFRGVGDRFGLLVDTRGFGLDEPERVNQRRRQRIARDREVVDGALRLRAPAGARGNAHFPHRIVLDACFGHVCSVTVPFAVADFVYQELLPLGADETPYRLLTSDYVS